MVTYQEKQLQEISRQFQIYGQILHAETCKIGHINETYSATYDQGGAKVRYIHQKINRNVFKDPPTVMRNLVRVTQHLRNKLEAEPLRDAWVIGPLLSTVLRPFSKALEYKVTGTLSQPKAEPQFLPKFLLWPLSPFQAIKGIFSGESNKTNAPAK